jgi:hypothetical protein
LTGEARHARTDHRRSTRRINANGGSQVKNKSPSDIPQANRRRIRTPTHNSSGHIGVCWSRRESKWRAEITVDCRRIHIGYFTAKAEAIAARKAAEITYGFHPSHGMAAA